MEKVASKRAWIVIPVFNEERVISAVISEVKSAGLRNILVVDDGSSDGTYQAAVSSSVIVVRHLLNRGKGAAAKTGLEAAKLLGAEFIVTMDGDGQHNPHDILLMLEKLAKNNDVILGTRSFADSHMPLVKKIANHIGNFFTWFIYGLWVSDSQSGFRAYTRRAINLISTNTDRYEYDSEIIREIYRHRLRFCEVPIEVRYTTYSMSKLHKQNFKNGIKTMLKMFIS